MGVSLAQISSVLVETPGFGIQTFQLPEHYREKAMLLSLSPAGKIKGRILAESADWLPTVRLQFTSDNTRFGDPISSEGIAKVDRLNPDGTFEVPEMPTGTLRIEAYCAEELPGRPRYPDQLKIVAGKTTELAIPFEAGTLVKGSVTMGGKPVAGASISVRYGAYRQGHMVTTDAEGNYTAYVLPGTCYRQVIAVPLSRGPWQQQGNPIADRFHVPKQDEPFNIPPVELLARESVKGRLVDQNSEPLGRYVVIATMRQGRIADYATTDDAGFFALSVAKDEPIEEYLVERVRNDRQSRLAATIVKGDPELQLQVTITDSKP